MRSMDYLVPIEKVRVQRRQVTPLHLVIGELTYQRMITRSVGVYRVTLSKFFEHTAMQTPTSLAGHRRWCYGIYFT